MKKPYPSPECVLSEQLEWFRLLRLRAELAVLLLTP